MGRPLNKKYFGNRNIGSTGTGDNYGIGGEGLASITTASQGSININDSYKHFPTLTVAVPDLPTGVRATTTVTWEIDTVVFSGGTNYTTGLTTSITGLTDQASVAPVINITAVDGGGAPTTYNFTGGSRGEFLSIDGTGITTWAVVKGAHSDAQATIKFRVKSIAINEKGSGYTALPSLSWTTLSGTAPSGQTPALTTDSGIVGSSTNQENAILVYAQTTSGGSNLIGDIIKQVSGRRYKVRTADGTAVCKLVTDGVANAEKEMTITATDANGNTYYVSKLTSRKAVLVRLVDDGSDNDWVYATGESAPWKFDAPTGAYVQIANA